MLNKLLCISLVCQSLAVFYPSEKFGGQNSSEDGVKLMFFYGSSFGHHDFYSLSDIGELFKHGSFKWWMKTVLYIHGYHETGYSKSVQTVVNAYFRRGDHNIMVLNWGRMLHEDSNLSVLEKIGSKVSTALARFFVENELYISKFHIVGFSFGAHLAGIIGQQIKSMTNGSVEIPRITGLDPPYFGNHSESMMQITSSDAAFVDVIHTLHRSDNGSSSVKFWPNGEDYNQPGCMSDNEEAIAKCNHERAWQYWAESVASIHQHKFYAIKASSWSDFIAGNYDEPQEIYPMGIDCPTTITGNFYLKTNDHQPFARGKDGIVNELVQSRARQISFVPQSSSLSSAKIIYYYGPTNQDSVAIPLRLMYVVVFLPKFNTQRKTMLFIHGYKENQEQGSAATIVDAYLTRNDHNILTLDYSQLAGGNYFTNAFPNAEVLAPIMADSLIKSFNFGLNINTFHLIGHSLGGQMAGSIGNYIINKSNGLLKLRRITALDPALPLFYYVRLSVHTISKNDADMVDIIHTDGGIYGSNESGGTVDFWPNGGVSRQPGCPERKLDQSPADFCSHYRSYIYYAESVERPFPRFLAVRAANWNSFRANNVLSRTAIPMGINTPPNARGNYYLQTHGDYPYARGKFGTIFIRGIEN